MEVKHNAKEDIYYIKEKLSNGMTLEMGFQETDYDYVNELIYYNVYLSVYHKRKQKELNEAEMKITGVNPFETYAVALKAYQTLENYVKKEEPYDDICIIAWGTDGRRRKIYEKILKRYGFFSERVENIMALTKRIERRLNRDED